MRLHASRRTRRWLIAIASICGVLGLPAIAFARTPTPSFALVLGCALLGAGLALAVVARAVRQPADACSHCHLTRAQVQLLIIHGTVSICDRCLPVSLAALANHLQNRKPPNPWPRILLAGLPAMCPTRISRPVLAAIAGDESDPDALREIAAACRDLHSPELARDLLERIPEGARRTEDWLDIGLAHAACGRPADALAATVIALNLDDGRWRPWCLNNRALFSLRSRPDAPVEQRQAWLRDAEEAQRLLAEKQPLGWKATLQAFHGAEAELRRSLGDVRGALRALTDAEKLGPLAGKQHLIRARVLAAGDPPLGRHDAQRALELLHPESPEAIEARALLATLP